jgi:hypothetical protein
MRQLRTFTSKATMYKYTARLIVHWAITGTAKGGQRHERDPHKPRSDPPVSGHEKRPLTPAVMVSTSGSRLLRRGLLGAVAGASSSIMVRKVAGIMARRVRADIGRLAAAIGRDPGTAGNFGSERLGRLSQTVW